MNQKTTTGLVKSVTILLGFSTVLLIGFFIYSNIKEPIQTKVLLETVKGDATINDSSIQPGSIQTIHPGDTFAIRTDGLGVLRFSDGSIVPLGKMNARFENFQTSETQVIFTFRNLLNQEILTYSTSQGWNNLSASVVGQATVNSLTGSTGVLGVRELTEERKEELWNQLNSCVNDKQNNTTYTLAMESCMISLGIESLDILA